MVSHYLSTFDIHYQPSGSGDITYLKCLVTLQEHMNEESYDFMG